MKIKVYTLLMVMAYALTACHTTTSSTKPQVTVSIAPQKYFIQRLVGDQLDINIMIPKGAGHSTYSPAPSQFKQVAQSVAYFKMGQLSFEQTWEDKLAAINPKMKWVDLSKGITLIQGEHASHQHTDGSACGIGADPHIWNSPVEMKIVSANLALALIDLFPELKSTIDSNLIVFNKDLDVLDLRLQNLSAKKPGLHFMIFHPAYTYLARAYGFEQLTIELDGKTPTPSHLKRTIELARIKNVHTIFIQQEFDKKNAEVIANEIGAKTIQVNPLSENWLNELNAFITHLEKN